MTSPTDPITPLQDLQREIESRLRALKMMGNPMGLSGTLHLLERYMSWHAEQHASLQRQIDALAASIAPERARDAQLIAGALAVVDHARAIEAAGEAPHA